MILLVKCLWDLYLFSGQLFPTAWKHLAWQRAQTSMELHQCGVSLQQTHTRVLPQKSHGKFPWTGSNIMDHNDWNNSMHIE